jgi:16S rRNA (uracil1498-N3)-methyltransferase
VGSAAHVLVEDVAAPVLAAADEHHLRAVLRLRIGDNVTATDGRGGLVTCRFTGSAGSAGSAGFAGSAGLEPTAAVVQADRPAPAVTVAFAPVKGDRPEWAVQKLTELGVDRIMLLGTARGVVRWSGDRAARQVSRMQELARQALMQSRGVWLPSVSGVVPFGEVARSSGACLAVPGGGGRVDLASPFVLVGPEGGWAPEELSCGTPHVGLGPGVLRTETAAVVAGVLLTALRAGVVGPAG